MPPRRAGGRRRQGPAGAGLQAGGTASIIVDANVAAIQDKEKKDATRLGNRRYAARWVQWLCEQADPVVSAWFLSEYQSKQNEEAKKKHVLNYCVDMMDDQQSRLTNQGRPAIDFIILNHNDFAKWITVVQKKGGGKPSQASYDAYRRGLTQFFDDHGRYYEPNFDQQLSKFYSGLKTDTAELAQAGIGKVRKGKSPLPMDLYKFLALTFLGQGKSGNVFAHLFLILQWNLMCRAKNVKTIGFCHMKVCGDALGIFFCHQKNDQKGERQMTRHIYANPIYPEICAFTALAMYWLMFPASMDGTHLFGKSDSYEAFRKTTKDFSKNEAVRERIIAMIGSLVNLGTHSLRKGAGTYATSCCGTFCPVIPIHQRGGWVMHGCDDEYFWADTGGDWYVGRLLSGLPPSTKEFASCPPHFRTVDGEVPAVVTRAIKIAFPNATEEQLGICHLVLPSIIHHEAWIRETMPEGSGLFANALFTTEGLIDELRPHVVTGIKSDFLTTTGVPDHVEHLLAIEATKQEIAAARTDIQSAVGDITGAIGEMKDLIRGVPDAVQPAFLKTVTDNFDSRDALTPAGAGMMFTNLLDNHPGFQRVLQMAEGNSGEQQDVGQEDGEGQVQLQLEPPPVVVQSFWMWGGTLDRRGTPRGWVFPSCTVPVAYSNWLLGGVHMVGGVPCKIRPWRLLSNIDIELKNSKSRFRDLKALFAPMDLYLAGQGTHPDSCETAEAAAEHFATAAHVISVPDDTQKGRKRHRKSQMMWATHLRLLRKARNAVDLDL